MLNKNEILQAYLRVNRGVTEEFRGHFGQMNLTFPQSLVLSILDTSGPMPISRLARTAGSANSTISGVVDRLEHMGLIQRVRSEQDHRVIYVAVTEQYRQMRDETDSYAVSRFEKLISCLREEEQQQVMTGLELLEKALKMNAEKSAEP